MNVFITCTSEKASHRCKAKDMYTSALFQKCWEYAQTLNPDKIYILSAKHHLLNPNTEINPYNAYMGDFSEEKKKEWADEVYKEMKAAHIDFNAKTYFSLEKIILNIFAIISQIGKRFLKVNRSVRYCIGLIENYQRRMLKKLLLKKG